ALFDRPPVLCGHRGSGKGIVDGHHENTLDSFRAAVAAGLGWVEVDARLNADGLLVSRHDPTLEDGRFVSELTTEETDELELMRVADLLEELPAEIGVDVDVKTSLEDALRPRGETTGALVADLLASAARRPVLVTSFDASVIAIVRERAPDLPVGLLTWHRFPLRKAIAAAAHLGADVVAPHAGAFLGEQRFERPAHRSVRVAHEAGLEVLTWSLGLADMAELMAAGIDCLVVDDAPRAAASQ
ncbi:MAG: glycerophosphoryl diester phosphodiesterase, partial [Thermoleophilaceae bacterium]|nr:glycerophosphoryl diester phosphodiesterase [Thermoleophilaceae bacterium]